MDFVFKNKRISGILTVLPKKAVKFEDEIENYSFSPAKCMKLKLAMGYKEHRVAEPGQTSVDFAIHGLQFLFDNGMLLKEDIDAILTNKILPTRAPVDVSDNIVEVILFHSSFSLWVQRY